MPPCGNAYTYSRFDTSLPLHLFIIKNYDANVTSLVKLKGQGVASVNTKKLVEDKFCLSMVPVLEDKVV